MKVFIYENDNEKRCKSELDKQSTLKNETPGDHQFRVPQIMDFGNNSFDAINELPSGVSMISAADQSLIENTALKSKTT